ncbi:MAG: flagellar biosynthetic protein FliR, partial [Chitinispirillia bacterium]
MIPERLTTEQIQIFLLIFVRITSMISLFPIFGSQNVPVQLKAGLSFLLAILLFPLIPVQIDNSYTFTVLNFGFVVIKEIFVGLTIGFASSLLFVSVQFAG